MSFMPVSNRILLGIVLLGSFAYPSHAMITEADVEERIIQLHPQKKLADANFEIARGERFSRLSVYDPKLTGAWTRIPISAFPNYRLETKIEQLTPIYGLKVFGSYAKADGLFASYDTKLMTGNDGELNLGFELPILRGGWTDEARTKLEVSEKKVEEAQANRSDELTELLLQAKIAYWDWFFARSKMEVTRTLLGFAKERDHGLERRSQMGDIAAIERKDNARIILNRKSKLNTIEQEWVDKTQKFSLYWRDSNGNPIAPSESEMPSTVSDPIIPQYELNELQQMVLEKQPEIKALKIKIEQARANVKLSENSILPALNLKLEKTRELGDLNPLIKAQDEIRAGLFLEISLPMRKSRGEIIQNTNQVVALQEKLRFTEDKLKAKVISSWQRLQLLKNNLDNAIAESKVAKEVATGEQKRFLIGQSNIISVNLREEASAEAQLRAVEVQVQLYQTLAEINALARPFL